MRTAYYNIHSDFILTHILEILVDGVNACKAVGDGIETYPLAEYIMTSLFLKLTGAQEQKMKCICWEIATYDFDFRYRYLRNDLQLGECSDYNAKNKIYKELLLQIHKYDSKYSLENVKEVIVNGVIDRLVDLFQDTNLCAWYQRDFQLFLREAKTKFSMEQVLVSNSNSGTHLFESLLREDYGSIVYEYRNRCAHNTTSYQRNLPSLETLANVSYSWHNYFYRFGILVLIDEIFIQMYAKYLSLFIGE